MANPCYTHGWFEIEEKRFYCNKISIKLTSLPLLFSEGRSVRVPRAPAGAAHSLPRRAPATLCYLALFCVFMVHLHMKCSLEGVLWVYYSFFPQASQLPGEQESPRSGAAPGRKQGSVTVSRGWKNDFLAKEKPALAPSQRLRGGSHPGPGTGLPTAARRPEMALDGPGESLGPDLASPGRVG